MDLRKSIALFTVFLVVLLVNASCTFPGFAAPQPATPTVFLDVCLTSENSSCDEVFVTDEPIPTSTPSPPTPTVEVVPTDVPTLTPEPVSWAYTVQEGSPAYIGNIHHENEGDLWMSIGGQVFGADEQPVKFIVIKVIGQVEGKPVELLGMSGSAHHYGPGGYDIAITPFVFDSIENLTITLYDIDLNQISEPFGFGAFADPDRLTTIINFVAVTDTP